MAIGYKLEQITSDFISEALDTSNAKDIVIQITGSQNAKGDLKIVGSLERVDYTQAPALNNEYDTIQVVDLQDGATIDGDSGISFNGDDVRLLELNTDALRFIGFKIENYNAGSFKIVVKGR